MVEKFKDSVWLGLEYFCTEGDKFWNLSQEDCVTLAVNELKKIGFIASDTAILASHRERVKKAYPAYFDTYKDIHQVIDYLNQIDNLYCIGRNGQHRYNNMDHSMATDFEAVENIMLQRKQKDNIWAVNTEKTYHEEK